MNGQYTFVNRIRFSVKKDELDELIAALKESRQSLEDIARARVTKDVPLPTSSHKATGLARFFDQIQGHASDLYSAISTAWADNCHVDHTTRFLLKSWPEAISTRRKKPRIAFKVAFAYGSQPGELEACKEIGVEILDEDDVEEQATYPYVLRSMFCHSTLIIGAELEMYAFKMLRKSPDCLQSMAFVVHCYQQLRPRGRSASIYHQIGY